MTSSVCCAMDQFGEALDTNDFSQYTGYSLGGGNVMDELFESVSMLSPVESHRCRTISTSSISSAFAGYNSCEIFPEIADIMVVSSGGGEYDIRDQLASGKDYIRVEDVELPQPNQTEQPNVHGHYDATTMEMLVTLGFKSRDLTSSHDLWPEINLCWASGKADKNDHNLLSTDEGSSITTMELGGGCSSVKAEQKITKSEHDTFANVSCMEGIAALDVTSLLEQFEEAESKAYQMENDGMEVCETSPSSSTFHDVDTNSSNCDVSVRIFKSESSNDMETNDSEKESKGIPKVKCLEPIKIDYLKSCKILEQSDDSSCQTTNNRNIISKLFSTDVDVPPKKKRGRPPKICQNNDSVGRINKSDIDASIFLDKLEQAEKVDNKKLRRVTSVNEIQAEVDSRINTEVDSDSFEKSDVLILDKIRTGTGDLEMQISEEKKLQMMEKARAISLKIGKKVHEEKLENGCPLESKKRDLTEKADQVISASLKEKMNSGSKVFKIPRLAKTKSENDIELKSTCETVSKVIPPLLKEQTGTKEGIKSWPKLQAKNTNFISDAGLLRKEVKAAMSQRSVISQRTTCSTVTTTTADKTITVEIGTSTEDKQQPSVSVSNGIKSRSPYASASSPNASRDLLTTEAFIPVGALPLNASETCNPLADTRLKCPVSVPSQEIIDKISLSTKRKSAILLPIAVPAQRERGPAMGIVLAPSMKPNFNSHIEKTGNDDESMIAVASENDSSDSCSNCNVSSELQLTESLKENTTSVRPVKRKLNLSQYKSILPERRKVLAPGLVELPGHATTQTSVDKSALSVVHFYGNCQQVGLDHDYCRKEDSNKSASNKHEKISSSGDSNDSCSNSEAYSVSQCDVDLPNQKICEEINSNKVSSNDGAFITRPSFGHTGVQVNDANKVITVTVQSRLSPEQTEAHLTAGCDNLSQSPPSSAESVHVVNACDFECNVRSQSEQYSQCSKVLCGQSTVESVIVNETHCSEYTSKESSSCSSTVSISCAADANSWRKTKQRAHRNYRGHGQQVSAMERYPSGQICNESSIILPMSQKVLESIDAPCSMQVDVLDTDTQVSKTFDGVPAYVTSSCSIAVDVEQTRQSRPAAVFSTSLDSRYSRSSSPENSIGCSSGSSVCSSRGYRHRRKSYSDSSSSRSRSPVNRRRWSRSKYLSHKRRSRSRSREYYYRSRSRSRSPYHSRRWKREAKPRMNNDWQPQEERRVMNDKVEEERRVVYVGRIPKDYTTGDLCQQLQCFGEITNCSVHIRKNGINEDGTFENSSNSRTPYDSDHKDSPVDEDAEPRLDHYGFVTFRSTAGAYAAIERGRTVPGCEDFDFSFGARRQFCKTGYSDLDGNKEIEEEYPRPSDCSRACDSFSFDALLKQATQQIKKKR